MGNRPANTKGLLLQIARREKWMWKKSGQRVIIYLGGKEPKPTVKEGEKMFFFLFVCVACWVLSF